jgi:hypothetical protein
MLIRCPVKFSSTFISKIFYKDRFESKNLSAINYGECFDWAYIAWCLFAETELTINYGHAWIKAKDKHYDSETIRGVQYSIDVPSNRRCRYTDYKVVDINFFKEYWECGNGLPFNHWDCLVDDILAKGLKPLRT